MSYNYCTKLSAEIRTFVSFAIVLSLASTQVMAQAAASDEPIEEVIAYGIRASIENAINTKRNAGQIMDGISAEDIGKFPDDNIGEALQRITGVSLTREAGEGKEVSIRGLGAGLSQVTVNGQSMASTEGNRNINFSVLDSSMVSALEVWKSPVASQDEGSVGGAINIVTRGPLDSKRTVIALSAAGQYEDLPGEWGDKYTGNFATQNDAQTLGFSIAVNSSTRDTRSDQVIIPGWTIVDSSRGDWNSRGWNQLAAAAGLDHIIYPMDASSRVRLYKRDRAGFNPTLQWRPTDAVAVRIDGFYSKLEDFDTNQTLQVRIRDLVRGGGRNVNNYLWEFNGNNVSYFDTNGANIRGGWRGLRSIATLRTNSWTSKGGRAQIDWDISDVRRLSFQFGSNKGDGKLVTFPIVQFQESTGFSVDLRGNPQFPQTTVDGGFIAENLDLRNLTINDRFNDEKREFVQLDLTQEIGGDNIAAISFGVKLHTQNLRRKQVRHVRSGGVSGRLTDFTQMCGNTACVTPNFTYANDTLAPFNGSFPLVDLSLLSATFSRESRADKVTYNESWEVDESTVAAYVQLDLDGELSGGMPYTGNLGVRFYSTSLTSSGWLDAAGTTPGQVDRTYSDLLPSLNLTLVVREDVLVRFGASKVMARADQKDLSFGGNFNDVELTARVGNPNLEPFRATALDLGVEWYFADAGLLSGALFYKDVDSFISNGIIEGGITVITPDGPVDFDASGPINGEGAKIKGFEFGYQQAFDFLPFPLDGFGVQLNYTYTDSSVEIPYVEGGQSFEMPLDGLSKYSYNSVLYYETDRLSVRMAYNYRDKFLSNRSNTQGNPVFTDAYKQLDASVSWQVTDTISLSLNAVNLNDEARYQYFLTPDRMLAHRASGRRFSVGVRARF